MKKNLEITPPGKELAEIRGKVGTIQKDALTFEIKTARDVEIGDKLLVLIKEGERELTGRKEEITRPLMKSLASVRDLFKPLEAGLVDAKKNIKEKMLTYQLAEEARIEAEKTKVADRVEKGRLKPENALKKLEAIDMTKGAKVNMRVITKVRVVDERLIPREYLTPDLPKIAAAVLQEGKDVPGAETYEDRSIVTK